MSQLPPEAARMNGSHAPFVHLHQWQGAAPPQHPQQAAHGGHPTPSRLPYLQPLHSNRTTPSPSSGPGISPHNFSRPLSPARVGGLSVQMSHVGAANTQRIVASPITESVTSPPRIFPLSTETSAPDQRSRVQTRVNVEVFSLPPKIPAPIPEPAQQAPGWADAASPRWFSTDPDEATFVPTSARSASAAPAPPTHVPGLQVGDGEDVEDALFADADAAGRGVLGLRELCAAVANFVGKREVTEAEVVRVTERMNVDRRGAAERVNVHAVDLLMFRQILRAIHPTDFAGRDVLKGWLQSTGILDAFTDELDRFVASHGASPRDALDMLGSAPPPKVAELCQLFHQRLDPLISHAVQQLKVRKPTQKPSAEQANLKFAMMDDAHVGQFADVSSFFKGLDGHIGLPSPRVIEMMCLEHVGSLDSLDTFVTTNYGGTETHPALEWEFVVNPDINKVYPGRERAPTALEPFLTHDIAMAAGLEQPEVIALRLFTGPMFMKYNAKLRNFPEDEVESLKGNGYVTTIHAVVSGVLKLSRIWKPPPDRKVYRGLGGMVLPERFWKADKFGCRGGVELALMSTTIKREVAIQYSGTEKDRPTIFEIEVGQVDRGASLTWVSQYPVEEEVVMPPLSNLEVVGDARMEDSPQGLVMVIPLRINVNLKSLTMNELKDRRKELHLSMVGNLYQEAQRDLTEELTKMLNSNSNNTSSFVAPRSNSAGFSVRSTSGGHSAHSNSAGHSVSFAGLPVDTSDAVSVTSVPSVPRHGPDASVHDQAKSMLKDFRALIEAIRGTDAADFNDDTNFKNAMTSALEMKRGTLRKFSELHSRRMQQVSEEVRQRILDSNCSDWARDGSIYRIISDTNHFPWEAVAEGKVKCVELLPALSEAQAAVAWEALAANCAAAHGPEGPPAVESVQIRGLDGKVGKVDVNKAINGDSFAMISERIGIDGVRIPELQGMGPDGVRLLLPLFRMNHGLGWIDLSRSQMGPDLARQLAAVLKEKPNLRLVKIRGSIDVRDARTKAIVEMAKQRVHGQLRRQSFVNLSLQPSNSGRQNSKGPLSKTLSVRRVRRMSLGQHGPDDKWEPCDVEGGIVLAALIGGNPSLSHLDLAGNRIGPEGATALAEVLDGRRLGLLRHLDLRDNNICAQGATAISTALIRHKQLTFLDVRDNRTGASGPIHLAPAISANQNLETLNAVSIESEGFGEGSRWLVRHVTDPAYEMVFVAGRIRRMAHVARLDLADCQLGLEGARLLCTALMHCAGLKELVLRFCALRAAGAVEIAPALRACQSLELLDLSNNLISCEGGGTAAIATALHGHPNLRRLLYAGNISEGFIEFQICFPRMRDPYRQLTAAVPRASVKFFPWSRVKWAMLSWLVLVSSVLAVLTGLVGAPISFAHRQYIFGFGIMGIGVMGLLVLGWWVRWTGVRWKLGFVDCFVKIVQQQEQPEPLDPGPRDRQISNASSTLSTELRPAALGDLELQAINSFAHHPHSLPWRAEHAAQVEALNPVGNGGSHPDSTEDGLERLTSLLEESRAAQEEQDLAHILGERLSQQLPMLLDQYVHNTTHPASLDQQLVEQDELLKQHWTIDTFFHSPTPLELALRRNVVKWLLAVFVLYFSAIFGMLLWPYIYAPDYTFRTFRVVIYQNQAREVSPPASLTELSIAGIYCAPTGETDPLLIFSRNTVVREYQYPVTVGRWKMVSSTSNPTSLDPRKFELQGCTEQYHHCIDWTSITGNRTDPDFTKERGADVWYGMDEPWQLTIVRFVPMVFAFGFLTLLYCSIANRQKYSRVVLASTFSICALLYIVSTHPMRITQDRMRWVSGGCLGFMPMMLTLNERYIVHAIVLYGIIYCPMAAVLFQRIYERESLPQWSPALGIRNYDQLTVMPIFVLANCFVLPMIARYCWYRAKTKVAILQDIKDYVAAWEELQRTEPDALKDLKGEVDKINSAIDQSQRTTEALTPRHRVTLLDEEDEVKLSPLAKASSRPSSSRSCGRSPSSRRRESISKKDEWERRISSLWQVYAQATGLEVLLRRKVQAWAFLTGGGFYDRRGELVRWEYAKDNPRLQRRLVFQKLKDSARAIDKVIRFYQRDVSRLLDICRQQIVFERVEDMSHCLAVIRQDAEVQLVRVKNRMDADTNQHKLYAGYRDVALNLRFRTEEAEMLGIDGHICEVRLVHRDFAVMLQGPEGKARHRRYEKYRTARGW